MSGRLQDYAKIFDYNLDILGITSELILCGEKINEKDTFYILCIKYNPTTQQQCQEGAG